MTFILRYKCTQTSQIAPILGPRLGWTDGADAVSLSEVRQTHSELQV